MSNILLLLCVVIEFERGDVSLVNDAFDLLIDVASTAERQCVGVAVNVSSGMNGAKLEKEGLNSLWPFSSRNEVVKEEG